MGKTALEVAKHPATYSEEILAEFKKIISTYDLKSRWALDPFAGTGVKLDSLPVRSIKVEMEWPWASQGGQRMIQGDSTQLPLRDNCISLIVTSCTYGNRLADHHNAQERHKACDAMGCPDCNFKGVKNYYRITYAHSLRKAGYEISPKNSGVMQFGTKYKRLHEKVWAEVTRVSTGNAYFLLNTSDFVKAGQIQPVTVWHMRCLHELGWRMVEQRRIETKRMRFGKNRELRQSYESVLVLKRKEG